MYRDPKVKAIKKDRVLYKNEDKPILGTSAYQKSFPNWHNGNNDVFHEKQPQYPFYSLPFKGESNYKQSFTEE